MRSRTGLTENLTPYRKTINEYPKRGIPIAAYILPLPTSQGLPGSRAYYWTPPARERRFIHIAAPPVPP